MDHAWIIGAGPCRSARARLVARFPRPRDVPPEAWFMSKQQRYLTALAKEVSALTSEELEHALAELASGTLSFGHHESWDAWFGYLAWSAFDPETERQARDSVAATGVLESLTTAAIAVVSPSMTGFDPGLPEDILSWLGRAPLRAACWNDGDWSRPIEIQPTGVRLDPALSAALFLVLQHLPPGSIHRWVRSLVDLGGPRWRAHLVCWLAEAWDTLHAPPGAVPARLEASPGLEWRGSHSLLGRPKAGEADVLLPHRGRESFLAALRAELPAARLLEWCAHLAQPGTIRVAAGVARADADAAIDVITTRLFDRLAT